MRATLAVAAREITERKLALLGALLLGLVPLAIPLLPGLGGAQARDVRFTAALLLSLTIFVAFPIAFGATIMVSEIVQKRFAFYFSRPLSSASIWAGKMLAALVLCVCGACLAAVPTLIVDGKRALAAFDPDGPATAIFLLSTLLFVVAAHILSSLVRLRSAWVVLDFFLAAALAAAIAIPIRSLFRTGFFNLWDLNHSAEWLLWVLAAPFIAVLLVASYVQVAAGRTDARRSHGALSATLWGALALIALPLAGFAWWVNAATPTDLTAVGMAEAAPRGTWVNVSGRLRLRGSAGGSFLVDTTSGRYLKRPSLPWWEPVAFSQDGAHAAWGEQRFGFFKRKDNRSDIFVADLASGRVVATGLECQSPWWDLALSPDGRLLAVRDGRTLAAFDVSDPSNPRQLAAFQVESEGRSFAFVDADTLRVFARTSHGQKSTGHELEITDLSLSSKKSLVTGRFNPETLPYLRLTADGRYLVGTRKVGENSTVLTLHDGRTGALVATLADGLMSPQLRFLTGGRIAVAGIAGTQARVVFFEGEKGWGAPSRSVDLGPARGVVLGREIAPARVAVALLLLEENPPASRHASTLAVVDAATGVVSSGPPGLVPADRFAWWSNPVMSPAEAGSPASALLLDADSRLVRLDPATGAKTVLLGKGK